MKILYAITKSNWGGAQKYVFDLATCLVEEGAEVVVAFGGQGILRDKLTEKNVRTIEIGNLERDVSLGKELRVLRELYRILKTEKPDVLHLNSSKMGAVGAFLGRLCGIPKIIFTAHGWPFREERPLWQVLLIKFISWLTILFSHKVICVSEKDYHDVLAWPFTKKKILIIHNGILIEKANQIGHMENPSRVEIVSIGELHKNKGFAYGLQAMQVLKNRLQNFHYTIYSFGGEEKEALEKMILDLDLGEFVDLIISKTEASQRLQAFDIYLLPSLKEGLPYVLLEAGLNSLAIVASDTGGVNEIVEDGKNGFLCQPKDVHSLALALERLIQDEDLRKSFALQIRKKIRRDFEFQKMLDETKNLYF